MPDGGKSLSSISAEELRQSVSKMREKRFETKGGKVKDFLISRHGNEYIVQVYDETI